MFTGTVPLMSDLEFRPRFRFTTPLSAEEVKSRIMARTRTQNPHALVLGGTGFHLVLNFPAKAQRSWTPQMDVDVEVLEGRTVVRCLIGPSPTIWMLFVGGYMFSVFVQDVNPGAFAAGITLLTGVPEVIISCVKAALFGLIAGLVACYRGLMISGGGAKAVGNAVNETVVYAFMALFVVNVVVTAIGIRLTTG